MVTLPVETVHKLFGVFDTLILTNNMYSDLRGMYVRRDLRAIDKTPFEKVYLKFCKYYHGFNKNATTIENSTKFDRFLLMFMIDQEFLGFF